MKSRLLKIVLYTLLIIIAIPLLAGLYFYIGGQWFIGRKDPQIIRYLESNKEVIPRKPVPLNSTLLDDTFLQNQVFLLGEIHGYADVQSFDDRLFMYLNKKAGVRFCIAEMDSTLANQLNSFLQKPAADTALLKSFVVNMAERIPQQSSKELYQKWLRLH